MINFIRAKCSSSPFLALYSVFFLSPAISSALTLDQSKAACLKAMSQTKSMDLLNGLRSPRDGTWSVKGSFARRNQLGLWNSDFYSVLLNQTLEHPEIALNTLQAHLDELKSLLESELKVVRKLHTKADLDFADKYPTWIDQWFSNLFRHNEASTEANKLLRPLKAEKDFIAKASSKVSELLNEITRYKKVLNDDPLIFRQVVLRDAAMFVTPDSGFASMAAITLSNRENVTLKDVIALDRSYYRLFMPNQGHDLNQSIPREQAIYLSGLIGSASLKETDEIIDIENLARKNLFSARRKQTLTRYSYDTDIIDSSLTDIVRVRKNSDHFSIVFSDRKESNRVEKVMTYLLGLNIGRLEILIEGYPGRNEILDVFKATEEIYWKSLAELVDSIITTFEKNAPAVVAGKYNSRSAAVVFLTSRVLGQVVGDNEFKSVAELSLSSTSRAHLLSQYIQAYNASLKVFSDPLSAALIASAAVRLDDRFSYDHVTSARKYLEKNTDFHSAQIIYAALRRTDLMGDSPNPLPPLPPLPPLTYLPELHHTKL